MPPHLKLSGNMKRNMVCEIKRYHMLIRFSSDKHMVPFYFTPNIFSTSSLCGQSFIRLEHCRMVQIRTAVCICREQKSAFRRTWLVLICQRTDHTDQIFKNCLRFPQPFLVRGFRGNIVPVVKHINCIATCGSGSAPSPDHRSCPSERHFSVRIPAAP